MATKTKKAVSAKAPKAGARTSKGFDKKRILTKFQLHESDTGSPEVQIAIMSKRIAQLTQHLKKHKKDNSTKRGLLQMVNKRRRLLEYLKRDDEKRYKSITRKLKLKAA